MFYRCNRMRLSVAVHTLVERQYALYNEQLMPAFERKGIKIGAWGAQCSPTPMGQAIFRAIRRPLLIPGRAGPVKPFPQVANKSLNHRTIGWPRCIGRENEIAIVKVRRGYLPRLICMPAKVSGSAGRVRVAVERDSRPLGRAVCWAPGQPVLALSGYAAFRSGSGRGRCKNLRTALRQGLVHRHYGQAVRLEVSGWLFGVPVRFLECAVWTASAGVVPRAWACQSGALDPAHRSGRQARIVFSPLPNPVIRCRSRAGRSFLSSSSEKRQSTSLREL